MLSSPNFTNNAWVLNFSAAPKKSPGKTTPSGFENYKGEVLMVVGKKAIYYFAVYNTNYNWDNDSNTWQQVNNSIKVDL